MNYKKIMNSRPLFLILITVILGILFNILFYNFFINKRINFYLILYFIFFIFLLLILLLKFKIKRNYFFNIIFKNTLIVVITLLIIVLQGFIFFKPFVMIDKYNNKKGDCVAVVSKIESKGNYSVIDFNDFWFNDNHIKIPLKLKVDNSINNFNVNDELKFNCELKYFQSNYKNIEILNRIFNSYYFSNADFSEINIVKNKFNVSYNIRNKAFNILNNSMSSKNASICYGVLFGDSSFINDEIKNDFSNVGISHILAVSGLHIGILIGFILFILKKLKFNKFLNFFIVFCSLLFYSFLCGFSSSVLRASIMFLIFYSSSIFGEEFDKLNSWSFAGIIILFFNPISLFSISFQLSFVCIFAIFMCSKYFIKIFKKLKLGKYLSSALGVSISINLLTLPIVANVFNKISLLGVFSNIIVLPFFTVSYLILFLFMLICLIFPFLSFILKLPEFFIHILLRITSLLSNIKFLTFSIFSVGYLPLLTFMIFLWFQNYLIFNEKIKIFISIFLIVLSSTLFVLNIIPKNYNNENLQLLPAQYNSNCVVIISNDKKILLGDVDNISQFQKFLFKHKINKINDFIISDFKLNNINNYSKIINEFDIDNVFIPKNINENSLVQNKFKNKNCFLINNEILINNSKFIPIYDNNQLLGFKFYQLNKEFLYANKLKKEELINFLSYNNSNIENLYVDNLNFKISNFFDFEIKNVYFVNNCENQSNSSLCLRNIDERVNI